MGGIKIGAVGTHTNALELVVYDEKGQSFTVKYHEMAPMLLNEMQKEHAAAQVQQHTIEGQQQVIALLSSRLERLEGKAGAAAASEGGIR